MKTAKQPVSDYQYLITVELDAEETDAVIAAGVPQFLERVGAMPLEEGEELHAGLVLRFGEAHADRALSDAVINFALPGALNDLELEPACSPIPEEGEIPQVGAPFAFKANVYVLPEMELSDYSTPVAVTVKRSYTTEDELDEQMFMLAARFSTIENSDLTGNETRTIPVINDKWVAETYPVPGINTVEELRAQMRNRLDRAKEEEFENQKVNAAVAELSQRLMGEAPAEIVDIIAKDLIAGIEEQILANEGKILNVVLKEQKIKREDFDASMYDRARASVREGLTMDAVFRHEGMEIVDKDLEDAIVRITASAGDSADIMQAQAMLREMARTPELLEVARRLKAGQWIGEHADVTVEV